MPQIEQVDVSKGVEALIKDVKNRDQIYSAIAHDMRSSLVAIKMIVEALSLELNKELISSEIREIATVAQKSIDDTLILLEDLLDWAKNKYNKVDFKQEDILSLVNDVTKVYENIAAAQNISFNVSFSDKYAVYVNKDMIKTCIRNLISNALKFSVPNSVIKVSIEELSDEIILSVSDSGCGISGINQRHSMSSKFSMENSSSIKDINYGFGLFLVDKFVTQNKGKLWFDLQENIGSTFRISLPKFEKWMDS